MEFKETKCLGCGTNESPIFFMPKALSSKDFWCDKCMMEEMKKRGLAQ